MNTFSINYQSVRVQKYYTVTDPDLELAGKVLALLAFLSSVIFFFFLPKMKGDQVPPLDLPLLYILFQTKLVKIESFSRSKLANKNHTLQCHTYMQYYACSFIYEGIHLPGVEGGLRN